MNCPFELCTANVILTIEQARPDDDELTIKRIPMHQIEGDLARFGSCPASLLIYPLDAYGEATLAVQAGTLRRILREGARHSEAAEKHVNGDRDEHSKTPHPDPNPGPWFRNSQDPPPAEGPQRPPTPRNPARVPMGSRGPHTKGESAVSDALRDQLRSLTILAIEGFGQGQELCATTTDLADRLNQLVGLLKDKQGSAHVLALGAVGSQNPPQAALNMIGSSDAAGSTLSDLEAALQLFLMRLAAVHASLGAAAENGRAYLAQI